MFQFEHALCVLQSIDVSLRLEITTGFSHNDAVTVVHMNKSCVLTVSNQSFTIFCSTLPEKRTVAHTDFVL